MLPPDINPILDEGAPTSKEGTQNAMKLADVLGLNFDLRPVSQPYLVGWGDCGANPKKVIFNWTFTINDIMSTPTEFSFDILPGFSPIILGLNQKKYSNTLNNQNPSMITFQRPIDIKPKVFYTYLHADQIGNKRLRLELVPHKLTTHYTLLAKKVSISSCRELKSCTGILMHQQRK